MDICEECGDLFLPSGPDGLVLVEVADSWGTWHQWLCWACVESMGLDSELLEVTVYGFWLARSS